MSVNTSFYFNNFLYFWSLVLYKLIRQRNRDLFRLGVENLSLEIKSGNGINYTQIQLFLNLAKHKWRLAMLRCKVPAGILFVLYVSFFITYSTYQMREKQLVVFWQMIRMTGHWACVQIFLQLIVCCLFTKFTYL